MRPREKLEYGHAQGAEKTIWPSPGELRSAITWGRNGAHDVPRLPLHQVTADDSLQPYSLEEGHHP